MKYKDLLIFFFCLTPVLKLERAILTLKGSQAYFFDVPIGEPHLTLLEEVWELMFYCEAFWDRKWVGKTWRIWNHSPMSPLRKRGVFCLFGWKNLHGCDICKSTGKRNPFTTVSYNNLQKLALERHQNSKDHILSITDLKLRKSFQATVPNAKKNIDNQTLEITRRHIVQHKKVYLMTKNNMLLIQFQWWNFRLRTVVVMLLFLTRNPKMFQRFPGIWNNANLRTPTVPSGTLNLWLKEP